MLRARVFTAAILLSLFLLALFYMSAVLWMVLLLALTIAGSWEWSRLAKFSTAYSIVYLIVTAILAGKLLVELSNNLFTDPYAPSFFVVFFLSAAFWTVAVPFLLKANRPFRNPVLLTIIGWLVLLPTALALYQLRAISPLLLLGFMTAIWISDTAAYFTGRAFGKNKLAPRISPGKTWEGVAGALVAVSIYAAAWSFAAGDAAPLALLMPLLLILAAMGIVGDLFESLLKRHAGVKDSGKILPGHGGILDRIDALTSTLPIAILALLLLQS
jgi:phosphatidate cytidylyltransferase